MADDQKVREWAARRGVNLSWRRPVPKWIVREWNKSHPDDQIPTYDFPVNISEYGRRGGLANRGPNQC